MFRVNRARILYVPCERSVHSYFSVSRRVVQCLVKVPVALVSINFGVLHFLRADMGLLRKL